MNITIKIGLIIAFAVAIVAVISVNYGPQHRADKALLTNDNSVTYDNVPRFLQRSFPNTDFSKASPAIAGVLTGGPAKDGIPAIDEPKFTALDEFKRADDIQAIVIKDGDTTKVYPYNILTWHEIVNDTANGVPIAVTFCPLCGSAIVFDRRLSVGESTFGVSGALIESNMVMYDRKTETLWQQSTGEALAGELFEETLALQPFQLSTMGEVRAQYPRAKVLSEDTGHIRSYGRNPYSGYNENDQFIFRPSSFDERYEQKEIMAVFRVGDAVVATPWLAFADGSNKITVVADREIRIEKDNGELTITDTDGTVYPFFFEMWFSFAVQNPDGIVIE